MEPRGTNREGVPRSASSALARRSMTAEKQRPASTLRTKHSVRWVADLGESHQGATQVAALQQPEQRQR